MNLEDLLEKIEGLDAIGNGTNIGCFLVALDLLYCLKNEDNRERFVHEYYKRDNFNFSTNLKKICYFCESILLEDSVYHKMLKSIEMDVSREELITLYNYYDAFDRIEKDNKTAKDIISEGFKIKLLREVFDSSNREFFDLYNKVTELKNRYDRNMIDIVTIIAIFIAIVIAMVSGISFSLEAFANVSNVNIMNTCLLVCVVGFFLFNIFYSLFKFIAKLCGRKLDNAEYVVFIDIIFALLIMIFTYICI